MGKKLLTASKCTFSLESGSSPITQTIKTGNEMSFKITSPIEIKINHLGLAQLNAVVTELVLQLLTRSFRAKVHLHFL